MKNHPLKRVTAMLLVLIMVISLVPVTVLAESVDETVAETGVVSETVAETTAAAEETTEAAQETTEAPQETTEAAEETTEVTTEATEEVTEATEEATEVTTEATEEVTEATEETTEATEEATEATEEVNVEAILEANGEAALSVADIPSHMTVIQDKKSTLAPGVTQREIVLYDQNGDRVSMFVAVADLDVETVGVYANYKDNQNTVLGMSKTTEQVAAAEAKHEEPYSVVVAINASYYNMTTGKPTGTFVMEGNDITTESEGNAYSFFAILKDGTPMIGAKGEYSSYKGQIAEAVGGYIHLVQDGQICSGLNTVQKYPRQTVGVTADNRVIIMSADGNQAPSSIGLTVYEQAEVMLALGCVEAVHLDGGGSMTYCAKPEGSDSIQILNSPSDGSERSVSNSLMFVSTAAPDGAFDHATLSVENEYVTPGSTVTVSAIGVDAAGGAAEIPAEISWQLADSSLGSVANGVFTSNGTAGDAVVQMVYGGKVVGEATVHVVIPESLSFSGAQVTVPYGKSVTLEMTALYGANEVAMKDGDVTFVLSNEAAGTISGFTFTSCAETTEVTGTTVTATLVHNTELTASTEIVLGKGSEVIYDFEDGTDGGLYLADAAYNYVWPESESYVVSESTGKVHSGSKALALHIDYSNSLESGYQRNILRSSQQQVFKNATKIGMWIYIPDEAVGLWARWAIPSVTFDTDGNPVFGSNITGQDIDGGTGGTGVVYSFQESGWHYLSMSIDPATYEAIGWKEDAQMVQFYICDRDGAAFNYYFKNQHNVNGDFTFYVDDITVDYSSAVDDREPPKFSSVVYANDTMADAVELNGQTSTSSNLSFAASVADVSAANATGLDASTASAYVDGNAVSCNYANGKISIDGIKLADGVHSVKFSICDKQGNYASVIRNITVAAESGMSTIKVVPHDSTLDRILLGSLYYVDIVATDIENVQSVTTTLDLDSMSVWNLAHMDVTEGFKASYYIQEDENIATVTITRDGDVTATGEAALVSIPVRTWELKMGYTYENGKKAGQQAMTYAQFKASMEFWPIYIDVEVDKGLVTFTDGTTGKFSGAGVEVATEMWHNYGNMTATTEGAAYFNAWNGGHIHTAAALEDKAATCTESGYYGRTFCSVCSSVVEWGTTIAATGHSYDFADGILKCVNTDCGVLFSGVHTDGKTYVDGTLIADGWDNDVYYVNGEPLTGIQLVAAPDASGEFYYDFGTDGISTGKYTGLIQKDEDLYYAVAGSLKNGWIYVPAEGENEEAYYYFDLTTNAAVNGTVKIDGYTYEFVDYKLYNGQWLTTSTGKLEYVWAGSKLCNQWFTLRGNTYHFDSNCYAATGTTLIKLSTGGDSQWFVFDETGVLQYAVESTGLYTVGENTYYLVDGIVQTGLWEDNGLYYYFTSSYKMYTGTYRYVDENAANGLVTPGYCYFDTDHSLLNNEFADPNGTGTDVYFVMGRPDSSSQWIEIDGKTYYLDANGVPVKSDRWIDGVYYYFDETDGHLCDHEFIIRYNTMYYCIGGQIQYLGLVEIDGATYYISTNSGRVMCNCGYWVSGDKNPTGEDQLYYFDEDGKMRDEEFFVIDGVQYYMIDGQPAKTGLTEIDGQLYYLSTNSGAMKTGKYYVEEKNANGRTGNCYYYFGADGAAMNHVFYADSGSLYYLENGLPMKSGLVLIDGNYYYLSTNSGAVKTGRYYVQEKNANGLLPEGWYTFANDGKMIVE